MSSKKTKKQTGPKPDTLKLKGDWQDAMNKALKKEKPKEGWAEPEKKEKKKESDST